MTTPDAPAVCRWCGAAILSSPQKCKNLVVCEPAPPAGAHAVERVGLLTLCERHGEYDSRLTGNCPHCLPCVRCDGDGEIDSADGMERPPVCPRCGGTGRDPSLTFAPATPVDASGDEASALVTKWMDDWAVPVQSYARDTLEERVREAIVAAAAVAMAERSDLLDAYRRSEERERAGDVQRLNERDRANAMEFERDVLQRMLNAEEADALKSGGILSDVCDIAFSDEMRAEMHGYEGIVELVRVLRADSDKVLQVAGIVNAHFNGDDGELTRNQSARFALRAIADTLGEPFDTTTPTTGMAKGSDE